MVAPRSTNSSTTTPTPLIRPATRTLAPMTSPASRVRTTATMIESRVLKAMPGNSPLRMTLTMMPSAGWVTTRQAA
jgi:hypothetical protein